GFKAMDGNDELMKRIFTEGVSRINNFYPQLIFLGPGHSHPFAVDKTYPSLTDITHHIRPYKRKNEQSLGYSFSLALIIVQDRSKRGWQACAFAMDSREQVRDLGLARVIPTYFPAIKRARATPFYRTRRGRIWEAVQKAKLRDKLIEHERWPGGW